MTRKTTAQTTPVDVQLAELGLERRIAMQVASFPLALTTVLQLDPDAGGAASDVRVGNHKAVLIDDHSRAAAAAILEDRGHRRREPLDQGHLLPLGLQG